MLVKKDNPEFNPNIPESPDNVKQIEIKDRQGINDEFHRAFQKNERLKCAWNRWFHCELA